MYRVNRSRKKNCNVEFCDSHYGRRKRGPHMRAEIVPAAGPIEAVVYRALNEDGSREAFRLVYDRAARVWSDRLALPPRPRASHAAAVARARQFVRSGVLAEARAAVA